MMVSDPGFGQIGFYFNWFNKKTKRPMIAASLRVQWDGIIERDVRTPMAHHVFTRLPDRSIIYCSGCT